MTQKYKPLVSSPINHKGEEIYKLTDECNCFTEEFFLKFDDSFGSRIDRNSVNPLNFESAKLSHRRIEKQKASRVDEVSNSNSLYRSNNIDQ